MHILLGAVIGAVVSVGLTFIASRVIDRPLTWKDITASAIAGIVGGAIASATLGVGAAGAVRTIAAFSAGGATGSASGQVTDNVLHGEPVTKDVAHATAFGTAIGAATFGVGKAVAPVARHVGLVKPGGHGTNWFAGAAAGLDDAVVPVTRYVKKALSQDPAAEEPDAHAQAEEPAARGAKDTLEASLDETEQVQAEQAVPEAEAERASAWIERLRQK